MFTSNIRKQGGTAVMSLPANILRMVHADIGTKMLMAVKDGAIVVKPISKTEIKRYSLQELLRGVTPEMMNALNTETDETRIGPPVGQELV